MEFTIKNLNRSIVDVARSLGYVIIDTNPNGEYNLVRRLTGANYPRFHAYVKQHPACAGRGNDFIFSLHLDQKQPSYGGPQHAHSGEYFGPLIDEEGDRIKRDLSNRNDEKEEDRGSGWDN